MKHLYTRTGDDGTTGLFLSGRRVSKASAGIEAVGQLDTLVSMLGVARASMEQIPSVADVVLKVQRYLFVVSADLVTQPQSRHKLVPEVSKVTEDMVQELENMIDTYESEYPQTFEFLVPGANMPSALLDLSRTQARTAERSIIRTGVASQEVLMFINRLSDLLYSMARIAAGTSEERSRVK